MELLEIHNHKKGVKIKLTMKDFEVRFRCTERMYNLLKSESSKDQVNMSEFIRHAINFYLSKKGSFRNA